MTGIDQADHYVTNQVRVVVFGIIVWAELICGRQIEHDNRVVCSTVLKATLQNLLTSSILQNEGCYARHMAQSLNDENGGRDSHAP